MNQGKQPTTEATKEQQRVSIGQMSNYIKNQLPALSYQIDKTERDEPGLETMAQGTAAASARSKVGSVEGQFGANEFKRGISPMSSNSILGMGDIASRGAGLAGQAGSAAKGAQRGVYFGDQLQEVGIGQSMLDQANRGLAAAGGIGDANARAAAARTASNQQAGTALITAAIMAFA